MLFSVSSFVIGVFHLKLEGQNINAATKLDYFQQDDIKDKMNQEDKKVSNINPLAIVKSIEVIINEVDLP